MPTANEALWNEQRARIRKLFRLMIWLVCGAVVAVLLISLWLTQPLLSGSSDQTVGTHCDPEKLREHVRFLSTDLYPRNFQNLENLNRAADHIRREFEATGGTVSEQVFNVNGSDYRNISLLVGSPGNPRIVIGAHYDAAGMTYGADDNASGVAGLLELARLIAAHPPKITVELVAFSLEEPPFFGTENMGSYFHVTELQRTGSEVRLMICLEMIGYFTDEPQSQRYPLPFGTLLYPSVGNFIAIVGDLTNAGTVRRMKAAMSSGSAVPIRSINAPSFLPGVDLSDHRNYWRGGYDAVMITDSAFYRNPNYHTVGDTYEKLDYMRMAEVVNGTYSAVMAFSE